MILPQSIACNHAGPEAVLVFIKHSQNFIKLGQKYPHDKVKESEWEGRIFISVFYMYFIYKWKYPVGLPVSVWIHFIVWVLKTSVTFETFIEFPKKMK